MNGAQQEGQDNIQGNANKLQHVGGDVHGNVHAGDVFQGPIQMVFPQGLVREDKKAELVNRVEQAQKAPKVAGLNVNNQKGFVLNGDQINVTVAGDFIYARKSR